MKRNLLRNLLAAIALVGATSVSAETGSASVKMTYVDGTNATASQGEIAAGEAAMSGYNKISGGSVELAFSGWNVNYITYIQVDASAIEGTITGATLTAEVSGSADSKRATEWGVGYNSSAWSADLTYDTADRTITTVGETYTTTSKSADVFETATFDISNALVGDEDKVVTLLVYETAAGGGYIKNPTVEVTYLSGASAAAYTVKYVLTGTDTEVKESTSGVGEIGGYYTLTDDDKASCFSNDVKYIYESDNAATQTIAADGSTVITVNFREAAKWAYSLKSNLGVTLKEGTDWEGETLTVAYPRHQVSEGTLYSIAANTAAKDYFERTFTLSEDNHVETIEYTATETTGVVFLSEAEDIATLTVSTAPNSNIRCSNGLCAYNAGEEDAVIATLPAGKYVLYTSVWGNADTDFIFKAGETQVLSAASQGYIQDYNSEEFELTEETDITLGATTNAARGIDFVYIVKTDAEEELPVAENIAALKKMESGDVKLMLNDAKVTVYTQGMMWGGPTIYLEDETGGIQVRTDEMGMDPFSDIFTKVGDTFNGYIYCYFDNFNSTSKSIEATEKTTNDTFTKTETEVVPTEMGIAEACSEDALMRLIKLSRLAVSFDPTAGGSAMPLYLHQGTNTMNVQDMSFMNETGEGILINYDFMTGEYSCNIDYVDNTTGYVMVLDSDEETGAPILYAFVPQSAEELQLDLTAVDNIAALKALEDGTEVALTLDNTVVTMCGYMSTNAYIQDKTGAFVVDGNIKSNLIDTEGVAMTGKLIGVLDTDYQGIRTISLSDNTDLTYFSTVDSIIAPIPTTIAEINENGESMLYQYFNLKDVTVTYDADTWTAYLNDGENTIEVWDSFYLFIDMWSGDDLLAEIAKFDSICGFVTPSYEEGVYYFQPYGEYVSQEKPVVVVEVASIAELKAQPSGTNVKLALNNLKVTAVETDGYGDYIYVEDETGAIMVSDEIPYLLGGGEQGGIMPLDLDESEEAVNPFGKAGNVLNGYLYCKYVNEYGMNDIEGAKNTAESEITVTEGVVTPAEITIDAIDIEKDEFRLVQLSNVKFTKVDGALVLTDGENTITVYDEYRKITALQDKLNGTEEDDDDAGIATLSEDAPALAIASATGVLKTRTSYDYDTDTESTITLFVPVGENPLVEDTNTGINSINSAIVNNGDVYTINGVKVRKAGESLNGLAKGLYIVNGKKVVIK